MKFWPLEGNRLKLDGGAMFGNAPKEMWKKWYTPDEKNRISQTTRSLLVQTDDGRLYLFEVGLGAFFEPKLKERFCIDQEHHVLLDNLSELGFSHTDIDGVILSHLHFDHIGGLLPAYGEEQQLLFPNAKYYVGKRHWEYALSPHRRERASFLPHVHEMLQQSKRLIFINGEEHPDLDFGVRFRYSDGHTVGMMLSILPLDIGLMIFAADLVSAAAWVHLPITMGYDRYPELKVDEKQALYDEYLNDEPYLFFCHDPNIAYARLYRDVHKKNYEAKVVGK